MSQIQEIRFDVTSDNLDFVQCDRAISAHRPYFAYLISQDRLKSRHPEKLNKQNKAYVRKVPIKIVQSRDNDYHHAFEPKYTLNKLAALGLNFFEELQLRWYSIQHIIRDTIFGKSCSFVDVTKPDHHCFKGSSKGLYLLIHGLNGHPDNWHKHKQISLLNAQAPHHDVGAIYVPKAGNGPVARCISWMNI